MKLQTHFYLLCILISIDWGFCYEYITNENAVCQLGPKRNTKSKRKQKHQHHRIRRQQFEEDKDPMASIDLANFIQQPDPDYEAIEDQQDYKDRQSSSKYYDSLASLNELQMSIEGNVNQRNEVENSNTIGYEEKWPNPENKLITPSSSETFFDNAFTEKDNSVKVSKRKQAVPFFSHNVKEKNPKKKRFNFGFRSKTMTTLLPKFNDPKRDLTNKDTALKRSNFQRFCPLCRRKILPKTKKSEQQLEKTIHNSRQFYQNVDDIIQTKKKENVPDTEFQIKNLEHRITGANERNIRDKRGYSDNVQEYEVKEPQRIEGIFPDNTQVRQLKELDEVQKKIDSVEIHFPHFNQKVT